MAFFAYLFPFYLLVQLDFGEMRMLTLPRRRIIKRRSDFQRVYRSGRSYANRYFVLYVFPSDGVRGRVGFAAGKKLGCAVTRNRVKRLLREAYQRLKDGKTSLYDMSDVSIKKGGKGDGSGTGLKEPTPIPTPTPVPATTPSGGNTKTPGGSGKSLGGKSSGSKSSTGSESSGKDSGSGSKDSKNSKSKNSKSSKDKNSGGWDFEAEPYTESEETSQMDTGEDGYQETAGESGTGSLTSKKKEYGMIFGFAAGGALAGGLAGSGIKAGVRALIKKRRKKK